VSKDALLPAWPPKTPEFAVPGYMGDSLSCNDFQLAAHLLWASVSPSAINQCQRPGDDGVFVLPVWPGSDRSAQRLKAAFCFSANPSSRWW
jgi:hypothetical protein